MPKHIKLHGYACFITTRLANDLAVFKNEICCSLLLKDLDFYRGELHYQLYAYVIMPDHFHWIIQPDMKTNIAVIMNKIKGHSSFVINKHLGRVGKLWQKGYHDHIIRNGKDFEEKANYIHRNPIRAGLVAKLENYKFSSYGNYYLGNNSLIKIDTPIYSIPIGSGCYAVERSRYYILGAALRKSGVDRSHSINQFYLTDTFILSCTRYPLNELLAQIIFQ